MQELDDNALLREYVEHDSEEAFAALVTRHVNKVYSVALRHTRNPHQAEEITQAVFVILARKSRNLSRNVVLSGWLYHAARLTAMTSIRSEIRRARREQEACMQTMLNETESGVLSGRNPMGANWPQIAPLLDAAMARLSETDRHAVVLRFFDGKSIREVGMALGASEDAAKMRVNRAVEKLRLFFAKRGIVHPAEVLTITISTHSVQAAPAALAKTVTTIAIAKGATAGGSTLTLIKGALKVMAWTKMKTTLVIGACLLAAGTTTITVSNLMDRSIRVMPPDWSVLKGNAGAWHWAGGKINVHDDFGDSFLVSGKEYGDFTMSVLADAATREASLAFRVQDVDHGYLVIFCPAGTAWAEHHPSYFTLAKRYIDDQGNHYEETLATFYGPKFDAVGPKAKIEVSARGPLIEVRLNGVKVLKARDGAYRTGRIGFRTAGDTESPSVATYSKLVITARNKS